MLILGIDTSTKIGSVALIDFTDSKENTTSKIISEFILDVDTTHSSRLLPGLDMMLKFSGISIKKLNAIAIAVGPGSFTGIRIGISTAQGLSESLKIPIVGIPTLTSLANNLFISDGYICPILHARENEIYTSIYSVDKENIIEIQTSMVIKIDDFIKYLHEKCNNKEKIFFIGEGVNKFSNTIIENFNNRAVFPPFYLNTIRASIIAKLGKKKLEENNFSLKNIVIPLYCRQFLQTI